MKKIVLISCVSKKLSTKAKAKDLYISTLFKYSLAYAYSIQPDEIFILSALHHVLGLDKEIDPYDVTLCNVPKHKRKAGMKVLNSREKNEWGEKVIDQLSEHTDLENDTFIILAGHEYNKPIINHIKHVELPMDGLRQGERVKFLKSKLSRE